MKTPRNVHLTALYKRSFAHHTVKNRMPIILTQIIDSLVRDKEEVAQVYGEEGPNDLKAVIGELSKLKYEIQTNKSMRKLTSSAPDAKFYNDYIETQSERNGSVTYFSAIWLLSECYMYRRIREAFELTKQLQNYDPFMRKKQDSYVQALPLMINLAQYLLKVEETQVISKEEFCHLLKVNLWGNKCDLSLSNGQINSDIEDLFNLEKLEPYILCDHSDEVWATISQGSSLTIDFVCDNAGYELFTDLCLADYLIFSKLASKIRFYLKSIPWFISDVTKADFFWMLDQLKSQNNSFLCNLGKRWAKYINEKTWILIEDDFWTLPIDFSQMRTIHPKLYKNIGESELVIFKGDLNYRKLFGEKNWHSTTPIDEALSDFNPTKLCALRTIKADIVCGLRPNVADSIEALDEKWMETGDYGLIQFSNKIVL